MLAITDWLIPICVGLPFTLLGCLKLYGWRHGIEGGRDKPLGQQLCGA
jgi:hypothetical protein